MRLLLDTHALLWALADPERLLETARRAISEGRNEVLASAACAWEIAVMREAGKLRAPDDLVEAAEETGFVWLAISPAHAMLAGSLPPHHRDPFDRMLVAQAQTESLTIVTRDERLDRYGVEILPA
jgi:PIN domain nuclease of toxin-antitoxin system